MLFTYLPILILAMLAGLFAIGSIAMSHLLGPSKHDEIKSTPYESGMPPRGEPKMRFHMRYYVMAMIFLAFDVEVTFLIPWAVIYADSLKDGLFVFFEMMFFFAILLVGYIYGWKKGAYSWD